jgi:hypothetical protein
MGQMKAAVLPLPVLAIPMMSRPCMAMGTPCGQKTKVTFPSSCIQSNLSRSFWGPKMSGRLRPLAVHEIVFIGNALQRVRHRLAVLERWPLKAGDR